MRNSITEMRTIEHVKTPATNPGCVEAGSLTATRSSVVIGSVDMSVVEVVVEDDIAVDIEVDVEDDVEVDVTVEIIVVVVVVVVVDDDVDVEVVLVDVAIGVIVNTVLLQKLQGQHLLVTLSKHFFFLGEYWHLL